MYVVPWGQDLWPDSVLSQTRVVDKASVPKTHLHSEKKGFLDDVTAITVIWGLL